MHVYIEASTSPEITKLQNLSRAIATLMPEDVVVLVDGDDWLATPDALSVVRRAHDDGAWVTWGSFEYADGRPGFARDLNWEWSVRAQPWVTTHLKTFRAGLFQRIAAHDLMADGKWMDRADDPAFMFPVLEMAGRDRCRFIPDVLYIYNEVAAWHRQASPDELRHQQNMHNLSRSRTPYERVEKL